MTRKLFAGIGMAVALVLLAGTSFAAQWANPSLLITPDQVKSNIEKTDWVVVDCRDLEDYVKGHIPGAISLGKRCKKALRDSTARLFNDTSKYESILSKVGIGNDSHVVFYHGNLDTLPDATVGFWIMEYLGHDKVHLIDGGLDAWRKSGNRLDTTPVKKAPKTFKAKVQHNLVATTDEVLSIANGKKKGVQFIDSRSKKEHEGTDIRALRGGHVPNTTMNVSHLDTLQKVKNPKTEKMDTVEYLDPDALNKNFGSLDRNKRTVAYCQTGTRSTLTYFELRLMGFKDLANWDESWRVYASDFANYPVEAPNGQQYYNFDKVNKDIKKLTKKLDKLEETLKKLDNQTASK